MAATPFAAQQARARVRRDASRRAETAGYTSIAALHDFFDAEITRVAVGTTVEWRNERRNKHSGTADDGSSDSGNLVPGAEFGWTF